MVTLSFSKAIVAELEQELIRAHALNNLRLYQLAQGLLWIHEGMLNVNYFFNVVLPHRRILLFSVVVAR